MACLAHSFAADGARTKCTQPEVRAGCGLCARHDTYGAEPRLPPAQYLASGLLLEEAVFFVPRTRAVVCAGKRTERPIERRCCVARTAKGQRCGNWCALLPFCPAHTLLELRLLVDLQHIGPGFQLGLYAFNPSVGNTPAVFVAGAEVVSAVHLSSFATSSSAPVVSAGGRSFYAELCAEPLPEARRRAVYGNSTAPNTFALPTGELVDCTWRQGAITMANMQSGRGNNAVIVPHELGDGVHTVSLEATEAIGQGRSVFVEYSAARTGPDAYDFARLPGVSETPAFPDVTYVDSLYDFRRTASADLPLLLPRLGADDGPSPNGLRPIAQTAVRDLDGMLAFFDTGRLHRLVGCPQMEQCQAWLRLAVDAACDARMLGVGLTVDAALVHRGALLIEAVLLWHRAHMRRGLEPDLALLALLYAVLMPAQPLGVEDVVLAAREHFEHALAPAFRRQATAAWTESDSVAARAYVAALAQIAPWKRPLLAERAGLPAFDQIDTREGWRINLPAALLCPPALCEAQDRLGDWRTRFLDEGSRAPIKPVHLRGMHGEAFAKVRAVATKAYEVLLAQAQACGPAGVALARTAFDVGFGAVESAAAADLGKFLIQELRL
jgi:hypothetical protein